MKRPSDVTLPSYGKERGRFRVETQVKRGPERADQVNIGYMVHGFVRPNLTIRVIDIYNRSLLLYGIPVGTTTEWINDHIGSRFDLASGAHVCDIQ